MQKNEILELHSSKNDEGKMFMKLLNTWSTLCDVNYNGLDFMIKGYSYFVRKQCENGLIISDVKI